MTTPLTQRVLGALVTLVLVACAWWLLAPVQVGGHTGYAIVSGTSMEPGLESGDLVLVRRSASYGVGDAVLFRSETLGGEHVLHRIVATENGRLVTRGDNRRRNDPDRTAPADVVGRIWLTVPGVGAWVAWLARPVPLAIFLFVLVFALLAGGREVSRRRRPAAAPIRTDPPDAAARARAGGATARSLLTAALAAAGLFALLAVVAWSRPLEAEQAVKAGIAHGGAFTYGARVRPSAVYPDGAVPTGQAVFRRLVRRLDISFTYRLVSAQASSVRGGIALDAVLSDGEGWTRTLPLAPVEPFLGDKARIEGSLDLRRLDRAVARLRTLTGTGESTFQVALRPSVQVFGYAGSTVVDERFAPELPLTYDGLALRLVPGEDQATLLSPRHERDTTRTVPTRVGVEPVALATGDARALAALGIAAALVLAGVGGLLLARHSLTEAQRASRRFGSRLVDAEAVVPDGRWISDVHDADSLARIADHYDRVVLHTVEAGTDVYLVDDGVTVYRYGVPQAVVTRPVAAAPGA
jgi:signal peptidase I